MHTGQQAECYRERKELLLKMKMFIFTTLSSINSLAFGAKFKKMFLIEATYFYVFC